MACRDQYRECFRECYFPLMAAVFGIDRQGMLAHVASRPEEAEKLLNLLRPEGTLVTAMLETDTDSLHRYRLPATHLPQHTQELLATPAGAQVCGCTAAISPTSACPAMGRTLAGVRDLHTWPQYQVALASVVRALDASKPAAPTGQLPSPNATAPGATLPPPFLPLPLCIGFLVLLASASANAAEPTYRATSGTGAYPSAFSPTILSYATTYLPHGKPSRAPQAPHLRLLVTYLHALLPQPVEAQAKPGLRDLGGVFLAVLLETLLSDGDMPAPVHAATGAARSPGLGPGAPGELRSGGRALASTHFVPPMQLRTKCVKARPRRGVRWRVRAIAACIGVGFDSHVRVRCTRCRWSKRKTLRYAGARAAHPARAAAIGAEGQQQKGTAGPRTNGLTLATRRIRGRVIDGGWLRLPRARARGQPQARPRQAARRPRIAGRAERGRARLPVCSPRRGAVASGAGEGLARRGAAAVAGGVPALADGRSVRKVRATREPTLPTTHAASRSCETATKQKRVSPAVVVAGTRSSGKGMCSPTCPSTSSSSPPSRSSSARQPPCRQTTPTDNSARSPRCGALAHLQYATHPGSSNNHARPSKPVRAPQVLLVQAFEPEKELLGLLRDMEGAVNRCRRRQPLPAPPAGLSVDLPVLAPLLLQQAEIIERMALAGVRPAGQAPAGAPECRLFVKEGAKCVPVCKQ